MAMLNNHLVDMLDFGWKNGGFSMSFHFFHGFFIPVPVPTLTHSTQFGRPRCATHLCQGFLLQSSVWKSAEKRSDRIH